MHYIIAIVILACAIPLGVAAQGDYICPMHPHIYGNQGDHCPICGMELVKINQPSPPTDTASPSGTVSLSPAMVQTTGVKTEAVTLQPWGGTVRAFGKLIANPRTEHHITSRANGWIATLGIAARGDRVKPGDLLYTIHSPDMVIAQNDYLLARKASPRRKDSASKLFNHYGIADRVIDTINQSGEPLEDIPYYATEAGTVTDIQASKGSYVTLNHVIATLQDFSTLWVEATLPAQDMAQLGNGTITATIALPSAPHTPITATVDTIYPMIDPATQTGTVRLSVPNPDGLLRPGGWVDVTLSTNPQQRLTVPSSALLHRSGGTHVILALGNGNFTQHPVQTGASHDGRTEILSGLNAGDDVVVNGQFLIDSEASLREALQQRTPSDGGSHAGH